MKRFILLLEIAVACWLLSSCNPKPNYKTLSDWKKHTERNGFRLLDAVQTNDYFITVYDTGRDEVAFCYYWRGMGPQTVSQGLDIRDSQMRALDDMKRSSRTDLSGKRTVWVPPFSSATYSYVDGMTYAIRRGYHGSMSIRFSDSDGHGGSQREIYDKKLSI